MDAQLDRRGLWWLLGLLMVAVVLHLSLMSAPPEPLAFAHADKLEHGVTFAWLALWFLQIAPRHTLAVMAALLALGVGIEIAQSFTPTRSPEAADVVADTVGLLLGARLAATRAGRLLIALERRLDGWRMPA